jgi:hypothetical protein
VAAGLLRFNVATTDLSIPSYATGIPSEPVPSLVVDAYGRPVSSSMVLPGGWKPTWQTVTPTATLPPPYDLPLVISLKPPNAPPDTTVSGPGLTIELTPEQAQKLASAEQADKWTDLPGKVRTSLGKRYNYIVQELTREIVSGGRAKAVLHWPDVTADRIAQLKAGGGRVVITEGRLKGGKLRFDFAEIDFDAKKVQVLDLTPTAKSEHMAKTKAYADELKKLTGFDVDSFEMLYVDEDGNLLTELEEVRPKKK